MIKPERATEEFAETANIEMSDNVASDFEVIESNLEVGDDMKTEEIHVPQEKSSHGGLKIPEILINNVELDHEQMKPPNPRNRSSPASSAGSGTSNYNTLEKRITTGIPSSLLGKIGDYKRENPTILACQIRERLISEGM